MLQHRMTLIMTTMLVESYSESCLPKTVKLGRTRHSKKLIKSEPKFSELPEEWEYDDRLLAFLAPCFKEDIENYVSGSGDEMVNMFTETQIKALDRELSNLLKVYLKQKSRIYSRLN